MKEFMDKHPVLERVLKTFVEAFLGVLIPEIGIILANLSSYTFSDWEVWGLPILAGAFGAGISAAWNSWQTYIHSKKQEVKDEE